MDILEIVLMRFEGGLGLLRLSSAHPQLLI